MLADLYGVSQRELSDRLNTAPAREKRIIRHEKYRRNEIPKSTWPGHLASGCLLALQWSTFTGGPLEKFTKHVPVKLPNGADIQVEVTPARITKDADVAAVGEIGEESWKELTHAVEGISLWVWATLQKVHPTKASIEFGIEIGAEPGKLTALLVQGSGKANLKITLEWAETKE